MTPFDMVDLQARLRDDGYCVLHGALDPDSIDAHLAVYECAARRHPGLDPGPVPEADGERSALRVDPKGVAPHSLRRVRRLWSTFFRHDTTHLRLAFAPGLHDLAHARFGREPVLVQTGTSLYSRGSGLHSDTLNSVMTDPPSHMLRFWCALEDIDPRSGPLAVYPGSHRLVAAVVREQVHREWPELLAMQSRHLGPGDAADTATRFADFSRLFNQALERVREELERRGITAYAPLLHKGDVLAFDPSLFHVSLRCAEPTLTRKSFLAALSALDAVWYGPRAYWGPLHDLRCPENQMRHLTEATPHGRRVIDYGRTLNEYERRALKRPSKVP